MVTNTISQYASKVCACEFRFFCFFDHVSVFKEILVSVGGEKKIAYFGFVCGNYKRDALGYVENIAVFLILSAESKYISGKENR